MSSIVGVDLGGTKIAAALVDDDQRILERARTKTPAGGPEAVVDAIAALVSQLGAEPAAVGVGAPGPVPNGVVATAPNLPEWPDQVPLAALLSDAIGVPVAVGNDANVGTLGEWVAGAGRGSSHLLGVWLGTGVGGGLVLDGRLYLGAFGGAGEFGHIVIERGGLQCGCGRHGCVEAYAGRASMERRAMAALESGRQSELFVIRDAKDKRRLTAGVWAAALRGGDALAGEILDDAVAALGVAVGAVVNLLDVERIVIGGGLTEKLGQGLADRIASAARPWRLVPDSPLVIAVAELGDDSGVVGAASLARTSC